jgi:O-antigen ligase
MSRPRPGRPLRLPARAVRRRAWATALATLFPLLSLVTDAGIGVCGFLFLVTALYWWRDAWPACKDAWPRIRWVALAFLLDLGWMACLMLGRLHDLNALDRPLRMCLMMAAIPVVLVTRPPPRALWLGAAGGALGGLVLLTVQRLWLGVARPGGWMNPITFGDLVLCLALLSLAGALGTTRAPVRWGAALGVLAGLAASLLTGSRGGWLMLALLPLLPLLLCVPRLPRLPLVSMRDLAMRWHPLSSPSPRLPQPLSQPQPQPQPQPHPQPLSLRLALALPLLALALAALAYTLPQTGVRDRIAIGVSDVRLYLAGNRAPTSLSVRLELWRGALMLVREHPWTGLATPDYKRRMRVWVAEGKLSPAVFAPPEPPHLHNDVLQVLVTRGAIGLGAWIGILLAPLGFFWQRLRPVRPPGTHPAGPGAPAWAPALAGLLLVLAYASFGLTEAIFWSMKANVFYALMVFLLMGWVLAAELDADGRTGGGAGHDAAKCEPGSAEFAAAPNPGPARAGVQRGIPNLRRQGRSSWSRVSASGNGPRWPRTPSRIARSRMRRAPR